MILAIPLTALMLIAAPFQDGTAAAKTAAVAPMIGDEVAIVVHVDLSKWQPERLLRAALGKLADAGDIVAATKDVDDWTGALKKAGAKDIYLLFEPTDFPGMPTALVPIANGADGKDIASVLAPKEPKSPLQWPASETIRGFVVAGTPAAIARIRDAKTQARPEVIAALTSPGNVPIQVAIVPSLTMRRMLEESMPALPPQVGGGPITRLSKGLRWASLTLAFEPKANLRAEMQASDATAAKDLQKLVQDSFGFLVKVSQEDANIAEMVKVLVESKPQTKGDRVTLEADLEKATSLVAVPIANAREAARRTVCINNLKQIALAMHNYHTSNDTFPAAFRASKDGKPLLSWRVLILPYLDQKELYNQFHLDEPWDSDHNKTLISKMPRTYACPSGDKALAAAGKTAYLTPRGPNTMFPGAKGVKLQEITDGTSNSIMVVEANDDQTVIWTKPDDWDIANTAKIQTLIGRHPGGINVGFGDGSVKFIKSTVMAKVFQALVTINGSEVINADDF